MGLWDSITSGVSNMYDKGMDFFSGDNSGNKQPTSIDPNNNSIDGDINGDGTSLLDIAGKNFGEVDSEGNAEGYSKPDENLGFFRRNIKKAKDVLMTPVGDPTKAGVHTSVVNPATGAVFGGEEDRATNPAYSNPNQAPLSPGEWDEDEYGRSSGEAQADNTRLQETYGTTDPRKIQRKNRRKGFFQNPVKSALGAFKGDEDGDEETGREKLGKGLQDIGQGLLGNSFNYDQF